MCTVKVGGTIIGGYTVCDFWERDTAAHLMIMTT
jgi:hypothetical protein